MGRSIMDGRKSNYPLKQKIEKKNSSNSIEDQFRTTIENQFING